MRALERVRPAAFGATFAPARGVEARFTHSGAYPGRRGRRVPLDGRQVVFSGDLGRYDVPIMRDPDPVAEADALLLESTYGNRLHEADDRRERLAGAVARAAEGPGGSSSPPSQWGAPRRSSSTCASSRRPAASPRCRCSSTAPWPSRPPRSMPATSRSKTRPRGPASPAARAPMPRSNFSSHELSTTPSGSTRPPRPASSSPAAAWPREAASSTICAASCPSRRPPSSSWAIKRPARGAGFSATGAHTLRVFGEDVPVRATILSSDAYSAHADQGEILRWLRGFRRPPRHHLSRPRRASPLRRSPAAGRAGEFGPVRVEVRETARRSRSDRGPETPYLAPS